METMASEQIMSSSIPGPAAVPQLHVPTGDASNNNNNENGLMCFVQQGFSKQPVMSGDEPGTKRKKGNATYSHIFISVVALSENFWHFLKQALKKNTMKILHTDTAVRTTG